MTMPPVHRRVPSSPTILRVVSWSICLLLMISTGGGAAPEAEYLVIVHGDNPAPALARAQVDAIYLGKITHWPQSGVEIIAISNQDENIRNVFSTSIHARPDTAVNAYWAAKAFQDAVAPPARLGDNEIVLFVAKNPGAIGYVSTGTPLEGVKRLAVTY